MASALSRPARATVIIPTYGHAPYVLWALASAQAQTVREMEICVLCDGSPPEIVEMLQSVAAEDDRIMVLQFSKAPRTGEIHRARVIPKTTGRIICYLCHDDLWFPRHVETLERLLQTADFGHTLHIYAGLGSDLGTVRDALLADIAHSTFQDKMLDTKVPKNFFGLTYGAHTREAYFRLEEGWSVTPDGIWTDLHMWRKFLSAPWCRCASYMGISLSISSQPPVAVAYDSTTCQHANEAVALDKCCVVVVADCELGQPYRWGDFVWDNGKKVA